MPAATGEKLLSVNEVAARLAVTDDTIYNYIRKGLDRPGGRVYLRAVKLGRYRVPEKALDEFLEALGAHVSVDFAGEAERRRREDAEASREVRKRLGID